MELKQESTTENSMLIKFISHRGNGYKLNKWPEGALGAVEAASKDEEIWGIEQDVRLTLDKVLVVHHNAEVKLVLPNQQSTKLPIKNTSYHELKKYMLESSKLRSTGMYASNLFKGSLQREAISERFSNKFEIATLEEVLKKLAQKGYNGEIILHIKDYSIDCLQALCDLIQGYREFLNIKVQCDYESLILKYYNLPRVPQGLLVNLNQLKKLDSKRIVTSSEIDFYSINWSPLPYYNQLQNFRNDYIQTLCENEKQMYFWTIDSLSNLLRLLKYLLQIKKETDIVPPEINIISNFPTLLYDYLNADSNESKGLLSQQAIDIFNKLNGQLAKCPAATSKVRAHRLFIAQ